MSSSKYNTEPVYDSINLMIFTFITIIYVFFVKPWLHEFELFYSPPIPAWSPPDTYTYWLYAKTQSLLQVPLNLIGPVSIFKIFHFSFDAIFFSNVILFAVIYLLFKFKTDFKISKFIFLLLLNPFWFTQFFAPNKEIYINASLMMLILSEKTKEHRWMIIAIAIACFSKIEFLFILLIFIFIKFQDKRRQILILSIILLGITFFYSDLPGLDKRSEALFFGQNDESSGAVIFMHKLSVDYYLFPMVLVIKTLINIFEGFKTVFFGHIYQVSEFFNFISGVLISGTFLLVLKSSRFIETKFFSLIFLIIFLVSSVPFPHHRYITPLYILLLFELFEMKELQAKAIK